MEDDFLTNEEKGSYHYNSDWLTLTPDEQTKKLNEEEEKIKKSPNDPQAQFRIKIFNKILEKLDGYVDKDISSIAANYESNKLTTNSEPVKNSDDIIA